jgi:hypothetical protein
MGLAADLATEDEGGGAAGSRLLQGRFVFPLDGLTDATDVSSGFKEIVAMPQILASSSLQIRRAVEVAADPAAQPFRMPVQWVNRPNPDFRGFTGLVAAGTARPGDRIRVFPSGRESRIARIVAMPDDLAEAGAGRSVTLTLTDEIDISRGDVIAALVRPAIESLDRGQPLAKTATTTIELKTKDLFFLIFFKSSLFNLKNCFDVFFIS